MDLSKQRDEKRKKLNDYIWNSQMRSSRQNVGGETNANNGIEIIFESMRIRLLILFHTVQPLSPSYLWREHAHQPKNHFTYGELYKNWWLRLDDFLAILKDSYGE